MRFSDVERGDFPWHNRDVIEYVVEHIAKLNASDKVCLKPIPVWLAEIGRNRPEEFKPLCEVEVTLDELAQDHVPVLITEHGRPAAYLVDVDSFELQQDKLRILEGIARGERAIEEGRVLTEEQAETRVTRWLN